MGWAKEQSRFQAPTLNTSVYWANPESYSTPGRAAERLGLRPAARRRRHAGRGEQDPLDRVLEPGDSTHAAPMEWQSVSVGG